jgi:hypothetical protein
MPLGIAGLILAGSACSSGDAGDGGTAATPSPGDGAQETRETPPAAEAALTEAEAHAALDRYERIANRANRERDSQLMASAEAGQLLLRSHAEIVKADEGVDVDDEGVDDVEDGMAPVSYEDRDLYIPSGDERWFMATATPVGNDGEEGERRLLTLAERDGEWKMVSALRPADGQQLPEIALDEDGLATAVPAYDDGGAVTISQTGDLIEEVWERRGEHADVLANTEALRYLTDAAADEPEDPAVNLRYARDEPEYEEVYAVRTADGGTLALVPLAHTLTESINVPGARLVPADEVAVFDDRERPIVTTHHEGEGLAHLPPSGEGVRLVSYVYEMVSAQ